MEKGGTGINLRLEAQLLGGKKRLRQTQMQGLLDKTSLREQLQEIRYTRENNLNLGRFVGMLDEISSNPRTMELIERTQQLIQTYAEIWNKDLRSGYNINNPSIDFLDEVEEMEVRLGIEEVERQKIESRDWMSEMQQRVQARFREVLGEIISNPEIPLLVQERAREIQIKLIH